MPSATQINELEQLARMAHIKNHGKANVPFDKCREARCLDARLSIAWLRAQQETDTKDTRTARRDSKADST